MSSTSNERLFRKVALERLSSPDRLDALLGLNRPSLPLVLAAFALALATIVYWGIQGTVTQKVYGRCVITSAQGVAEITLSAAGRVVGLSLKVGDKVTKGQEVARIVRPEIFEQITQAQARLEELQARRAEILRYGRVAGDQSSAARAAEQSSLNAQARLADERASAQERRIAIERGLFAQGLITKQTLLDSEQAMSTAVLERERLRDQAKQTMLQMAEDERQRSRERASVEFQVNESRRNLDALLDIERQTAPVISPYSGRVIEVKARNGASLAFGSGLIQVERTEDEGGPLEVAIFIPGGEGKLVTPGMSVDIIPDYVRRQEDGFLRGRVTQVSDYPASMQGMRPLVQNDNLLRELAGSSSPIFARAVLSLLPDGSYQWSSAGSRPLAVRSGALCQAEVTVGERRPAALAIPTVRKWLGLS